MPVYIVTRYRMRLGTRGLIEARNEDFAILQHDPVVVASLVVMVALFGPALVLVDPWLDRRLPHPTPDQGKVIAGFGTVASIGLLLTMLFVIPMYLGSSLRPAGLALFVVGMATAATWWYGVEAKSPPGWIPLVASLGLVAAVGAGLAVTVPEVLGALG